MKSFDARTYSISDFLEWRTNDQLDLSLEFQRRSVWPEKAKSYLIDTVIRSRPIPKILITQDFRESKKVKKTYRIVVDGQQRLRAIFDFYDGNFAISRAHNPTYAGQKFSSLPESVQNEILQYEIAVDVLFNTPYEDLLDIFARINTYTVKLNPQELFNTEYLGYFKTRVYDLGYRYVSYFKDASVLTNAQITRMGEAELCADLLGALCGGIQTNKNIRKLYDMYEDEELDIESKVEQFDMIMGYVGQIYPAAELKSTNWRRIQLFYTLFTSVAHGLFGLVFPDGVEAPRPTIDLNSVGKLRLRLDEITARYDEYTETDLNHTAPQDYADFIERSRRGTTDTGARLDRTRFVCRILSSN